LSILNLIRKQKVKPEETKSNYQWSIICASRKGFTSPLEEVTNAYVDVEDNHAFVYPDREEFENYKKIRDANARYLEDNLQAALDRRKADVEDAKNKGASERQLQQLTARSVEADVRARMPNQFLNVLQYAIGFVMINPAKFEEMITDAINDLGEYACLPKTILISFVEKPRVVRGLQACLKVNFKEVSH
jgi:hypothetical protein